MFQVQIDGEFYVGKLSLADAERIARDLINGGTLGEVSILWLPEGA